jgi:imidazole glycerol-phosphate synthase subunit HisF
MLKNRIIPCLDVSNGRVVKGINFIDLKDAGDPVEHAEFYAKNGADEICFLDITASHQNRDTIIEIVKKTAEKCFVPMTVGGGVKSIKNIRDLLLAGADKVSINTAAVNSISFVKEAANNFGSQCIVVAIDAKKISNNKWEVYTHGGRNKTGIDVVEFAKQIEINGAGEILLTSMDKDGTKTGYDLELLKFITQNTNIPVIASGGVGNLDHFYDGIIKGGASAVLAASIFHYGEYKIKDAKEYLNSKNVSVRL